MGEWRLDQVEDMKAVDFYEIAKHHRLVPDNPDEAVLRYQSLEQTATVMRLSDGDEELAIFIICNILPGNTATIEMIPHPQYFRGGYNDDLVRAMQPLWESAFNDLKLRKLTAFVPSSRGRTKKALKVCGFRHEGKIREMVKFKRKNPEDVFVLGLLSGEQVIIEECDPKDMDGE